MITKVVFWQNEPSPHQSAYIRELATVLEQDKVAVDAIFLDPLRQERIDQGWHSPDFGKAKVIVSPTPKEVELTMQSNEHTLHIISSFARNPRLKQIYTRVSKTNAHIAIFSEGRDWRGVKGLLRRLHSYFVERRILRRVSFTLAVGSNGVKWFKRCGYPSTKLVEFCYVVEATAPEHHRYDQQQFPFKWLYVGSLNKNKRVSLLLKALSSLEDKRWTLTVIGDGPQRQQLEEQALTLGLDHQVTFEGIVDNHELPVRLGEHDTLVLPSYWDGWGAVVSESIMCGTPAIVSNHAGASSLAPHSSSITVFKTDSILGLTKALSARIALGKPSNNERERIKRFSRSIRADTIAHYLKETIAALTSRDDHQKEARPCAPWATSSATSSLGVK